MATLRQKVNEIRKKFNGIVNDLESLSEDYASDLHKVKYRARSKDARDLVSSYTGHDLFDGDMLIWILKDRLSPEFIKYLTRLQEGIPKGRRIKPSKEKDADVTDNIQVHNKKKGTRGSGKPPKKPSSKAQTRSDAGRGRGDISANTSKRR